MSRETIFEASTKYFLRPVAPFLEDDSVTEIMVNGHEDIYVERDGRLEHTSAEFESEDMLLSAVQNVAQWVGREITEEQPVLDARLPNGSRVHAIIPPSSRGGIYLTIRKFTQTALTLDDFVRFGSLSPQVKEFLEICVKLRKNIVISGGTGTGKTCLLGALSRAIPEEERIVVIEDTSELRLIQKHCLYLEARHGDHTGRRALGIRQLFANSLRMRPDRIIVGEVRSGEALDLIQSMLSGHAGSLSTVHANSGRDALIRLETLSLMSDVEIPVHVARSQVAAAIHLVVQLARFPEDGSRRVTRVMEVRGLDDQGQFRTCDLFASRFMGKTRAGRIIAELEHTGERPTFAAEPAQQGIPDKPLLTGDVWSAVGE